MKKQEKKYVYFFGAGQTEGNANMRELLGGKGANLAEMAGLGIPVPQGFTISTEACTRYYDDGKVIADDIMDQVNEYVEKLEKLEITVSAHTTDGKKLYGSVGVSDILLAIEQNRGIKIERSQLELDDALKEVGEYNPSIDLGHGVIVKFKITIIDEEAPKE